MTLFLATALLWHLTANALPQPSGDDILLRVDRNVSSGNRVLSSEMIIYGRRGKRSISSKSWISGRDKAFTEYLAPARERGTKMLKLADQLWTYTPATDRTIRISGHMLRQSLMGSDLSYEDMMEDQELHALYTAEIVADTTLLARPCWILHLAARERDIAYHTRKIWVDKERYLPLREERFAKSGKLLKTLEVRAMQKIENRWVMTHGIFRDALKSEGEGTEFVIAAIEFDVAIPDYVFSKAALRR